MSIFLNVKNDKGLKYMFTLLLSVEKWIGLHFVSKVYYQRIKLYQNFLENDRTFVRRNHSLKSCLFTRGHHSSFKNEILQFMRGLYQWFREQGNVHNQTISWNMSICKKKHGFRKYCSFMRVSLWNLSFHERTIPVIS